MPLLFWLPIILLSEMFAVAADDLQELTSVQLRAFQSSLAIDTSQRSPPITTSPTKSFIKASAVSDDKRAQGEYVPARNRAWPVFPSRGTQTSGVDRRSAAL